MELTFVLLSPFNQANNFNLKLNHSIYKMNSNGCAFDDNNIKIEDLSTWKALEWKKYRERHVGGAQE